MVFRSTINFFKLVVINNQRFTKNYATNLVDIGSKSVARKSMDTTLIRCLRIAFKVFA